MFCRRGFGSGIDCLERFRRPFFVAGIVDSQLCASLSQSDSYGFTLRSTDQALDSVDMPLSTDDASGPAYDEDERRNK